ncbi:hypothetical protein F5Y01DRAFT_287979 [Xylaria sp. FL0043]|nr:hypothetical protein F5Y01DRAFT_287979 [Xylaria sp. FL0043]
MNMLKMHHLPKYVSQRVTLFRHNELLAASKVQWMMVYYTPLVTKRTRYLFTRYHSCHICIISSARGQNLDTGTAFTTVAILTLIAHPANMITLIYQPEHCTETEHVNISAQERSPLSSQPSHCGRLRFNGEGSKLC